MAYVNSTRATQSVLSDRVLALATTFRQAMQRRRVYAQTVQELKALSDRDLADLGISRVMIGEIAMQAAYGK